MELTLMFMQSAYSSISQCNPLLLMCQCNRCNPMLLCN